MASAHRQFIFIILFGCLGVIIAWLFWRAMQPTPLSVPAEKKWRVLTIAAEPGNYHPQIILHGITESPNRTTLRAAVEADVKATPVQEGDSVQANDSVLELDNRETHLLVQQRRADIADLQAQIDARNNRYLADKKALMHEQTLLELNRKAVGRQRQLLKQRVGSPAALDIEELALRRAEVNVTERALAVQDHAAQLAQLKARLLRAQSLLEQAELDHSRTKLTAPFTARIAKVHVAEGDRVREGDALITLYAITGIEVRAQIPATYVAQVSEGLQQNHPLKATAVLDNEIISLTLDRLTGEIDIGSGGVDGLFRIEKSKGHLILGRFLQLTLNLPEQKDLYAIPTQALYGQDKIYFMQNNRMRSIRVQRVGMLYNDKKGDRLLVRSSELRRGDRIIVTHLPNARTGLFVEDIKKIYGQP